MDQKIHQIFSPNRIFFGIDSSKNVGKQAVTLGGHTALIVADKGIIGSGLINPIQKNLDEAGLKGFLFDKVTPEPSSSVIDESASCAKDVHADVIIGVGGGSSMDVAKGTSFLANNSGSVRDYCGIELIKKRGTPMILLPTTAGTGSEVSRSIMVIDEKDGIKKAVISSHLLADLSIVDPMLTLSMPGRVTADSGIDSLVHAMETYVSMDATPFSDLLAAEAIRLISQNLPIAFSKNENIAARYNMSLGALFSGMAFSSGGLGAVHALAYPLSTEYHLTHGRSNAVMLPHVVEFNLMGSRSRYAAIVGMMGRGADATDIREKSLMLVSAIKGLLDDVQIPYRLRDYDIPKDAIPKLVDGGMNQSRLFGRNPRNLDRKEVEAIYHKAW